MLRNKWRIALVVAGCLLVAAAWGFQYYAQRTLHRQLLIDAQAALAAGDFAQAEELARRVIASGDEPASESRLVAGEAAVAQGAGQRALAYLQPLLEGEGPTTETALGAAANIYWDQGDLTRAEKSLRKLLQLSPENVYATSRLAFLLTLTGRHWESGPLRLAMMQRDSFDFEDLLLWGNARALIQSDELTELRRLAPSDPLAMLGAACVAQRSNDLETAHKLLPKVLAARPDLVEAHVLEGYRLLEKPDVTAAEIAKWNRELPAGSDDHPDVWIIRGLWSKRAGENLAAGRCFWEAVRRSPNHHVGNYQLALLLREEKNPDAEWFRERAESLEELQRMLGLLDRQRSDIATMQRIVELTEKMGRSWEAWGWSRVALLVDPSLKWAQQARDRAAAKTKDSPPQVLPDSAPGSRFDYSAWPLPKWMSGTEPAASKP